MARLGTSLAALTLALLVASGGVGTAATSSTVVGATVPSATTIDTAGCASGSPGVTSFGSVTPGASVVTSADCTVTFGSSNDTARLRVAQADGSASAMNRVGWAAAPSGVATDIRRVDMVDASTGYAATAGRVLKTTTSGATWSVIDIAGDGDPGYWGIEATSATTVWAVGASGHIWRSTDGGTSWTRFASGLTTATLDEVSVAGSDVYAAGASGTVVYSRDGGATWAVAASGAGNANTVAALGNGVVLVAGVGNVVRRTSDGGATWSTVHAPGSSLEYLSLAADGSIWVAGAAGHVARSTDAGITWTTIAVPATTTWLEGIHAFDRRTAVVAGRTPSGAWITTDGGATWTPEATGATNDIQAVEGVSIDRLVTTGVGGEVRRRAQDQPILDFALGAADWDAGGSTFGACLRAIGAGTSTDGSTWTRDTAGTAGDCAAVDTDPWYPITTSPSAIALASSGTTTAGASLRFGMRTAGNQPAGSYLAHLRFEVVAPG